MIPRHTVLSSLIGLALSSIGTSALAGPRTVAVVSATPDAAAGLQRGAEAAVARGGGRVLPASVSEDAVAAFVEGAPASAPNEALIAALPRMGVDLLVVVRRLDRAGGDASSASYHVRLASAERVVARLFGAADEDALVRLFSELVQRELSELGGDEAPVEPIAAARRKPIAPRKVATSNAAKATPTTNRTPASKPTGESARAKPKLGLAVSDANGQIVIKRVVEGSPAARAGLIAKDRIVAIDALSVSTRADLVRAIGTQTRLTVDVDRSGKLLSLTVDLSADEPTRASASHQTTSSVSPDLLEGEVAFEKSEVRATHDANGAVTTIERTTSSADLSGGGATLSVKTEKVERLPAPPSAVSGGAFSLSFGGAFGSDLTMLMGTVGGRWHVFGGTLPGPDGGGMAGIDFATDFSIGASHMSFETDFFTSETTSFVTRSVAELSFAFGGFSAMNSGDLKQAGVALRLGGFAGVTTSLATSNEAELDVSPTYGPVLALELPSYNAGTTEYSSTSASLIIIPIEPVTVLFGLAFEG
ncbi:MAG: PDZ domain-containing protein [Deltaproteobacteria bacterium]